MAAASGMPGHRHHAEAAQTGSASSLTAIGPERCTMIGFEAGGAPAAIPSTTTVAPARQRARGDAHGCPTRCWPPRRSVSLTGEVLESARYAGVAPLTAGLSPVPGGGTTHWPLGDRVLRPSTATAMPDCGGGVAEFGS